MGSKRRVSFPKKRSREPSAMRESGEPQIRGEAEPS